MLVAHKHGWLHQDVSDGNVMLNEKGRGILNDWDHGIREDPKKPDVRRRSVSLCCPWLHLYSFLSYC